MGTQHQANPKPLPLTSRLEENGNVPAADAQAVTANLDSGFCFPKSFSGGPTKLLMVLQD